MNCSDLDQVLDHFNRKIETIYTLIPLSQLYDNYSDKSVNQWKRNAVLDSNHLLTSSDHSDDYSNRLLNKRPDLREISQMIIEMKAMTDQMKSLLIEEKQQIMSESNDCESDLMRIQRHCDHIQTNIPPFLQKTNQKSNKSNKANDKSTELGKRQTIGHKNEVLKVNAKTNQKLFSKSNSNLNAMKSTQDSRLDSRVVTKSVNKKTVPKEVINIPNLSFITTQEFESIPHYMLGRLTYEMINRAIGDFNRAIGAKYKIIRNYCNRYCDEDMRKYANYKEQENNETEGQFFCTINDLKELSDLKADTTVRKILTCLRHCKRIREIRGNPPKLVRYAIVRTELNIN